MKKQISAILMALLLAAASVPCVSATGADTIANGTETAFTAAAESVGTVVDSGTCGENLTWTLYDNGELVIEGDGAMTDWENNKDIPWYSCREQITKVTFPVGITSIGEYAFCYCYYLTSVTIPDSVVSIGEGAFTDCTGLTSVTIPAGVASVGKLAFYRCLGLTSVAIYSEEAAFDSDVFLRCPSVLTLYGYAGSTAEAYAAENGYNFDTLSNLPDAEVTAFGICGENLTWILYDNGELVISGEGAMTEWDNIYNVPWCSHKKSITSVVVGEGVTSISKLAFYHYESLASITVDENNPYYSSDNAGVLFNKDKTELVKYPEGKTDTSYSIPDSVTSIGAEAFREISSLTSIVIPAGVKTIGNMAFVVCDGLTSVVISEGVETIGDAAFGGCTNLTSVVIPASVTSIGAEAFSSCSTLTSVVISEGVETIGSAAFGGCTSLTSVVIPNGVTSIGSYAFSYCNSLASVVIPDSVTSIGSYAFSHCDSLTSIVIPDGVTSIGEYAFSSCSNLTSVVISKSVTSVSFYAFAECSNLTSVTIYSDSAQLYFYLFMDCSPDLTLYGYIGSTTETYAANNRHNFVALERPIPDFVSGDITDDGVLELSDALLLFKHSMMPDVYPISYSGDVDFNKDGAVDIADAMLLFRHSMMPDIYPLA